MAGELEYGLPEDRESDLAGLFKEPLLDMLTRQQVNEIADRIFAVHRTSRRQPEEQQIGFFGATPVDAAAFETLTAATVLRQQERIQQLEAQLAKSEVREPIDCSPDCFCQKEAAPARLIAERVYARHQPHRLQTETIILFDDEECRRMDRRQFRKLISERLNAAGDALLAAWEQLHGERSE